jgi:hypothetical protein
MSCLEPAAATHRANAADLDWRSSHVIAQAEKKRREEENAFGWGFD